MQSSMPHEKTKMKMVEDFLPVINSFIRRLRFTYTAVFNRDDAIQAAYCGLLVALEKHPLEDRGRICARIKGAIADEARKQYPGARSKHLKDGIDHSITFYHLQDGETSRWFESNNPVESTITTYISNDWVSEMLNTESLTEQERDVIERFVIKEESLPEIGRSYGVVPSRISQIKTKGLRKIKRRIEAC